MLLHSVPLRSAHLSAQFRREVRVGQARGEVQLEGGRVVHLLVRQSDLEALAAFDDPLLKHRVEHLQNASEHEIQ